MTPLYPQLETFLREFVGLNPDATPGVVERAVDRILQQRPEIDPVQYLELLKSSEEELDHLIEQVLVPETWFFRYPEAYNYLQRWVVSEWKRHRAGSKLKILSVPCSTGEEPYSIAMALLDAGFNAAQFAIDAADISVSALHKAEEAMYSRNSFRGAHLAFRDKYFHQRSTNYHLQNTVSSVVRFFRWNVQQPPPRQLKSTYDVIFCRNLFIYFHKAAQRKTIATLNRLLAPEGLLFAGHAEAGTLLRPVFASIPPLKAFVHCKS